MVKLLHYGLSKQLLSYCLKTSNKKWLKQFPNQLKTLAANKKVVSLSSVQLGSQTQYFIYLSKQYMREGQWSQYTNIKSTSFTGMVNAEIKDSSDEQVELWEECASYPGIKMLIKRPVAIKIDYMNEELDDFFGQEFQGFEARVIQHQIDHYLGQDYLRKCSAIRIIDPKLREKNQEECDELLSKFGQNNDKKKKQQQVRSSKQFKALKQFITYSIVDKSRQN